MAFEGAISSLGATRAEDGSIDRIPDPPPALWDKLAWLGAKCDTENLEILSIFEDFGGNHHGLMKREKFCTALKDSFSRYHFDAGLLREITDHYGVGYKDPRGLRENVAWKDFCEDVLTAMKHVTPESRAKATEMARGKGVVPGKQNTAPVLGWQPE